MSALEFESEHVSASKAGCNNNINGRNQNSDSKVKSSRPPSGKANTSHSKTEDTKSAEGGKLLRDKQIEERKQKNAERKAAVEDRRKQKEREDNAKHKALRHLLEHKPPPSKTTGRKLPSVPNNGTAYPRRETPATRRLSSSSSSSEGHTPPGSGKGTRNTRRNLTGPTSASTSSLNSFGGTQSLGTGKPKSNLGALKKTSVSTNNLNDGGLGNDKTGQRGKEKGTGVGASARRSVGSSIPKAQSMGAIHQVGHTKTSRPPAGKKAKPKAKPTHHAGTNNEAEAGRALSEHRKKMREETERKALLDKEKQDELRRQREEEEKQLAEENAKEMARQTELAVQLQKQQEERAKLLREQREKEAEIEAEKLAEELRRKDELEVLKRQEMERRAAEAERREREEEERLKREEIERQERRKRVEMIMSRTRMTSTVNSNMTNAESYSSLEDLSTKLSDECHSSTVSEILQKVKEKSQASPSPEKDIDLQKENQQLLENSGKDSLDGKNEISNDVLRAIDNSKHGLNVDHKNLDRKICDEDTDQIRRGASRDIRNNLGDTYSTLMDIDCTSRDTYGTSRDGISHGILRNTFGASRDSRSTSGDIDATSRDTNGTLRGNDGSSMDTYTTLRDTCGDTSVDTGSTLRNHVSTSGDIVHGTSSDINGSQRDTGNSLHGNINGFEGSKQDAELWANVQHLMILRENEVKNNLASNGIYGKDLIEDEDGEEGQLWKVVEGKRHIYDVI